MVGLAVVAAIFIAFALTSSFLAPRRWPDFPGRQGLSVFIIACFVLFAAMLTAVEVFGVEKSESKSDKAKTRRRSTALTSPRRASSSRETVPEKGKARRGGPQRAWVNLPGRGD